MKKLIPFFEDGITDILDEFFFTEELISAQTYVFE